MTTETTPDSDWDNPWKEALRHFLERFLAFFFPDIHKAIDWKRGYEDLEKEFQQIVREAAAGKVFADKLFKVWLKDGARSLAADPRRNPGARERVFPKRMFDYNVRARLLHGKPVVSLAVLCDEDPAWRPDCFVAGAFGCELSLKFRMVKLLDYRAKLDSLEQDSNPFAQVVLAHLKALETRKDTASRFTWK